MTLVMTLIRHDGIWQSTDHRVVKAGQIQDDAASKQLTIVCPPFKDGPKVLLAFTGLAEAPDGTPMLQWLRETIRGETRSIMPTLEHICERLSRDVGRSALWHHALIFSGGVFEASGKRFYVEITNVAPQKWLVGRGFRLTVIEVAGPAFFAGGSGTAYIGHADLDLVARQAQIRPAKWEDHLGLLAAVNRRTAARVPDKSVSPWCYASFLSVDGQGAIGRSFHQAGDPPAALHIDTVLFGIDTTEIMQQMVDEFRSGTTPSQHDTDQTDKRAVEGRP